MGIQKDKLTEDQKLEIERLRQFVARNRLDARMNGTKWRAAIDAVMAIEGYHPSFRVKRVTDADEPAAAAWDSEFPGHIPLYNSIEWLELHPQGAAASGASASRTPGAGPRAGAGFGLAGAGSEADFREALRRGLAEAGVPIEETPGGIRIIGYARSGSHKK